MNGLHSRMKMNAVHLYPLIGVGAYQDDLSKTLRHNKSFLLFFPQIMGKITVHNFLNGIDFTNVLSTR